MAAMAAIGMACAAWAAGDREVWAAAAERIARPVLEAGAEGRLQASLPMTNKNRASTAAFEAISVPTRLTSSTSRNFSAVVSKS